MTRMKWKLRMLPLSNLLGLGLNWQRQMGTVDLSWCSTFTRQHPTGVKVLTIIGQRTLFGRSTWTSWRLTETKLCLRWQDMTTWWAWGTVKSTSQTKTQRISSIRSYFPLSPQPAAQTLPLAHFNSTLKQDRDTTLNQLSFRSAKRTKCQKQLQYLNYPFSRSIFPKITDSRIYLQTRLNNWSITYFQTKQKQESTSSILWE